MNTERHPRNRHQSRGCRNARTHEAGRRFGEEARGPWTDEMHAEEIAPRRYRGRRHSDSEAIGEFTRSAHHAGRQARRGYQDRAEMQHKLDEIVEKMDVIERRMRRIQAAMRGEQVETRSHHEITRTRRTGGMAKKRHNRRAHEFGRKMGRMSRSAWRDRQPEA